jgi:hypothetical protein
LYCRAKSQKLLSVKHVRKPPAFWERKMTVSSSLLDLAPSMTLKLLRNTVSWKAFFGGLWGDGVIEPLGLPVLSIP